MRPRDGSGRACGGVANPQIQIIVADVTLYAQWFTTAGLTPDNRGMQGALPYQFAYDSSLQKTPANAGASSPMFAQMPSSRPAKAIS